ncbi:MAG: hypothetical protein K2K22_07390, partial [Muribaculaceae bacterium]|nr:hypothetical protein [Muribaculaceae bacterium]
HNTILYAGDEWRRLSSDFQAASQGESLFSIVYLGDSHVQADFSVAAVRRHMAEYIQLAGRGLIIPFKLASTNQPLDYTIRTTAPYVTSKLLKMPWPADMPFTGVGVQSDAASVTLEISCTTPFNRMRLLSRGQQPAIKAIRDVADSTLDYDEDRLRIIHFSEKHAALSIDIEGNRHSVIGGMELMSDTVGLVIHSIGNNGATYSSYGLIDNFGQQLSQLAPNLIVIDLGTNEAFGRKDQATIENDIDCLVKSLRHHNPSAAIVLATPASCYKKAYRRYKSKSGRWRKSSYKVENQKVSSVADAILHYARRNGIACYNRYALAGGTGSAKKMQDAKLLSRDGVHYTQTGYKLWGALFSDALLSAFKVKNDCGNENFSQNSLQE